MKDHASAAKVSSHKRYQLKKIPGERFDIIKQLNKELFLFSYNPLSEMSQFCSDEWGYALFDANGCLLRLFSTEIFMDKCEQRDIVAGTLWDTGRLGKNAVGNGLEINEWMQTTGRIHEAESLSDITLSFSPISCDLDNIQMEVGAVRTITHEVAPQSDLTSKHIALFGGIAIISFDPTNSQRFLPLVEATAREISMTLIWMNILYQDASIDAGSLIIDQDYGQNQIKMMTSSMCEHLNLDNGGTYSGSQLEGIVDALPQNEEFWNIVHSRKAVTDYLLTLSVKEKPRTERITTFGGTDSRMKTEEFNVNFQFDHDTGDTAKKNENHTASFSFDKIVGRSPSFMGVLEHAKTVAPLDSTILLLGESGVGKDVLAQSIHNASKRRREAFVSVNCAVFSKELISSELFGYESGAFTGAKASGSVGKFEIANHGTLFLDEIGDMPLELQAHLLRAIEEKRFMRVGGAKDITSDVRIIAATNNDLEQKVKEKLFREDLYYRLKVIAIRIPPLREHKDDIIPLAERFIAKLSSHSAKPVPTLTKNARNTLLAYPWPGNVRQLQNIIERILLSTPRELKSIDTAHIMTMLHQDSPQCFFSISTAASKLHTVEKSPEDGVQASRKKYRKLATVADYDDPVVLVAIMEENNNSVKMAAEQIGISYRTLYRKLKKYNISW